MGEIKFGTDGWRAVISDTFTFKNVRIVAQAIADYVKKTTGTKRKKPSIVVGYDARFLSREYAEAVTEVLAGNGIKVSLSKMICTTPMVSYIVKDGKFSGGIVVTASHNPASYNGIKFKADYGGPADEKIIAKITNRLYKKPPKIMNFKEALKKRLVIEEDYRGRYMAFLKKYINLKVLKNKRFRILVDNMNGAASTYLKDALKGTSCKVDIIREVYNPGFEGKAPEPIAKNLAELIRRVKKEKYDIGIALDGDVDRIGAVDSDGKYISSQTIIPLLIEHMAKHMKKSGAVATTISGSTLIRKMAEHYGFPYLETPVGFKHICELMRTRDVLIGGEESGGIGFKDYIPERDGILSGILILEMMAYKKMTFKELIRDMHKRFGTFVQLRLDYHIPERVKKVLYGKIQKNPPHKIANARVADIKTYDGIKLILANDSHLLLRFSGTEPILRIYAEGHTQKEAEQIIRFGKALADNA